MTLNRVRQTQFDDFGWTKTSQTSPWSQRTRGDSQHTKLFSSLAVRNLFTAAAHPSPLLFLPGVRSEQLKLLLEFLYIGECQLPEHDLKEFLAVAAKLKISGLVEDIDNIEEQQRSGSHEDKTGSRHEGNPKDVPLVEEPEFIVDRGEREFPFAL